MGVVGNVERRPARPVMIYDGDCHFCKKWVARWRQATGGKVDYIPLQGPEKDERFPEIPRAHLEAAVHLVEPDGSVYRGAEAVFRALAIRSSWPLRAYQSMPGVQQTTEAGYRFVASHRTFFSMLTRLLWGRHVERLSYLLTGWIFVRLMGVIYLCAFVSLWVQVRGLYGTHGILPIQEWLTSARVETQTMSSFGKFLAAPTVFWFGASDSTLQWVCGLGTSLAAMTIIGISPALCLFGLWLLYLSFCTSGGDFLGFQWDALLLEAGLLAVFLAPARFLPNLRRETELSRAVVWLLRWLVFRLMFSSGVVKLASGDETWKGLTALKFHYETQPLPTWLSWYAHQLPEWVQRVSTGSVLALQLGLPFLIFLPRRARHLAAWCFMSLELLIALTGNYCFFNLLSISLCLLLFDDALLLRWVPRRWRPCFEERASEPAKVERGASGLALIRVRRVAVGALSLTILVISSMYLFSILHISAPWPAPALKLYSAVAPFRSINSYGLFAVMTTTRPEIILEGSNDGQNWMPYEFKYKPGALNKRPSFVEPHQPRLDWQMWFAALGTYRGNPWFVQFCRRLLQGNPEVLNLLATNPFPNGPPKVLRAKVYEYHFTNWAERQKTGQWWKREEQGLYLPTITLENFRPE
ncbi:MAG: hypothetical protein JWM16_2490 [Verrucomicrobiales bacterium]|nr:hypothetical protein [Verrucomicrobiales bacterium]